MNKTINTNHIKEVFSDPAFVGELFAMESPEDAQAALRAKGVELSLEELKEVNEILSTKLSENGELSLDDLDSVAGGGPVLALAISLAIVVGVAGVGGAIGIGVPAGAYALISSAIRRRW